MHRLLKEAKNLGVFKKLLGFLAAYSKEMPATGYSKLFDQLATAGIKAIPSDKLTLQILDDVLVDGTVAKSLHNFINYKFTDLPKNLMPRYRDGRKLKIACWVVGEQVSYKVMSLVDFTGKGKGYWCDLEGNKVTLLDTNWKDVNKD